MLHYQITGDFDLLGPVQGISGFWVKGVAVLILSPLSSQREYVLYYLCFGRAPDRNSLLSWINLQIWPNWESIVIVIKIVVMSGS